MGIDIGIDMINRDCEISLSRIAIIPAPFGSTDRAQVAGLSMEKSTFSTFLHPDSLSVCEVTGAVSDPI